MHLYAHWLDGEYIKLTERLKGADSSALSHSFDRMLKLHALFGNEIILNDVQIIDSSYVLQLFSNPEFRRFLTDHPYFLRLVARAEGNEPRRFSIATSGIRRSLAPGWVSSAFGDSLAVVESGRAILETRGLDPGAQLAEDAPGTIGHIIKFKWPKYSKLLEGMLWAVHHFASESSNAPVAEPPPNVRIQSFYEVLKSIAGHSRLIPEHEKYVEDTLAYITTHVEDETARHRRAVILNTLNTQQWPVEHQVVWHTVVHAWNCAVQNTLGAHGSSIGALPLSAPIGIYLDTPTDALVPVKIRRGRVVEAPFSGKTPISMLSWDPAVLRWNDIQDALDKTSATRETFQEAFQKAFEVKPEDRDYRSIFDAVEDHCNTLAQCFEKSLPSRTLIASWVISGTVALVIGGADLLLPSIGVGGAVSKGLDEILRRGLRFRVANTLRESAYKLISAQKE